MPGKCKHCSCPSNNPTGSLCNDHIDALRKARADKERLRIGGLLARGPVYDPDVCEHDEVIDEHCFDCDTDGYEGVCPVCHEWTDSLLPCCGVSPHDF